MINFTTVEKEYIIEWLQERSNECYECASGNWFRDPTPEQRAEFRNEHVRYVPTNDELRLHIWYTAGNRFHRSFGPDGGFVEIED